MSRAARVFIAFLFLCGISRGAETYQLLTTGRTLEPGETVGIRFGSKMVDDPAREIGPEDYPLRVEPELPFSFRWESSVSGAITFEKAPPLGCKTVRILPKTGLRNLAGQPVEAPRDSAASRKVPDYGVISVRQEQGYPGAFTVGERIPANFKGVVTFNFSPAQSSLNDQIYLRSDRGEKQAVSFATYPKADYESRPLTWNEMFLPVNRGRTSTQTQGANRLLVTPLAPLGVGRVWSIFFKSGIRDAEAPAAVPFGEEVVQVLGLVEPLKVEKFEYHRQPLATGSLKLKFNKPVGEPAAQAIRLSHWEGLSRRSSDSSTVEFEGTLTPRSTLELLLPKGTQALDGTRLEADYNQKLLVPPVPARLYFDEFLTTQFKSGRREFHILGVNVGEVSLKVQRIPSELAPEAYKQWSQYRDFGDGEKTTRSSDFVADWNDHVGPRQINRRVEIPLPPEATVFQKTLPMPGAPSAEDRELHLNWDDLVGAGKGGLFLVTAEGASLMEAGKRVAVQTLTSLTDIGFIGWDGEAGVPSYFQSFSFLDGRPLGNALFRSLNRSYAPLEEVPARPDGSVQMRTKGTHLVTVSSGGEIAHLETGYSFLDTSVPAEKEQETPRYLQVLFTDRGAYRPGETLHAKGFLREVSRSAIGLPKVREMVLSVTDSEGREVWKGTAPLSETGSWTVDLTVPRKPDQYSLRGRPGGLDNANAFTKAVEFMVAEFEQDKFAASILADSELAPDKAFTAKIQASYLSGQPLNDAKVAWTLRGQYTSFQPRYFENFVFSEPRNSALQADSTTESPALQALQLQGSLKLQRDGSGALALEAHPRDAMAPLETVLEAEITDLNQQSLVVSHRTLVHSSDFYLGMRLARRWIREGEELPIAVLAVNPAGDPVNPPQPVELSFQRIREQRTLYSAAGETHTRITRTFEPVSKQTVTMSVPSKLGEQWLVAPTQRSANVPPLEQGSYLVSVSTRDAGGRPVESRLRLEVDAPLDPNAPKRESGEEGSLFKLTAERSGTPPIYSVGETARLLILSEQPGHALLSVHQNGVLRTQTLELTQERTEVTLPILGGDIPGVEIQLTRVRGIAQSKREIKTPAIDSASLTLRVHPKDAALSVELSGLPPNVKPRTALHPKVRVLLPNGKPAAGAEVTLYAVDEGVLRMTNYQTPAPIDLLCPSRFYWQSRYSNLRGFQREDRDEEYAYLNKGFVVGDGGADSGDVRHNFPLTVLWVASAKTDADGILSAEFRAPDNLSQFRVMAVAAHGLSAFGSGEARFRIQKQIQLQPGVPQFARVGDQLRLRGIVQNLSDKPVRAEVRLRAPAGTTPVSKTEQTLSVEPKSAVPVDFDVRFETVGEARFVWHASVPESGESDAVESVLPVEHATPLITETQMVKALPGETELTRFYSPGMLADKASVQLKVLHSSRALLHPAARALLHYPYGCAEQTVSSTLPWVLASKLGMPELDPAQVEGAISKGIERLRSMRVSSGGIAYWPGGATPMPFASAYAAVLLGTLRSHAPELWDRLALDDFRTSLTSYLKRWLEKPSSIKDAADFSTQCLALYGLATLDSSHAGAQERLLADSDLLSDEDRALLALAYAQTPEGTPTARKLLKMPGGKPGSTYFSGLVRENALRLLALRKAEPDSPECGSILATLLQGQRGGVWESTQGNAWGLLAALDALPAEEDFSGESAGTLELGGRPIAFKVSAQEGTELSEPWAPNGAEPPVFKLQNRSSHPMYAFVSLSRREQRRDTPPQREGYTLTRSFEKLDASNTPVPDATLQPGDRVLVKLTLTAHQSGQFLAIESPLPANLEPVQSFATREAAADQSAKKNSFSDFSETHADRFLFFRDWLPKGEYVIEAVARVRCAGEALAPAARVEEMYRPERYGQTAPLSVSTRSE